MAPMLLPALVTSFCLSHASMAALSLSMARHHQQLNGHRPSTRRARLLRVSGWLLLALALTPATLSYGPGIGAVAWLGSLSAAAWLQVLLLSYKVRWTAWLAGISGLGGAAALAGLCVASVA
jgi:hypothetical protein